MTQPEGSGSSAEKRISASEVEGVTLRLACTRDKVIGLLNARGKTESDFGIRSMAEYQGSDGPRVEVTFDHTSGASAGDNLAVFCRKFVSSGPDEDVPDQIRRADSGPNVSSCNPDQCGAGIPDQGVIHADSGVV